MKRCEGCGGARATTGMVERRDDVSPAPSPIDLCAECWEAVDGADPETGAYGAAHVPLRRVEVHAHA